MNIADYEVRGLDSGVPTFFIGISGLRFDQTIGRIRLFEVSGLVISAGLIIPYVLVNVVRPTLHSLSQAP